MIQKIVHIWQSLRVRVAVLVALPTFLILGGFSVFHATREIAILQDQARLNALQLGAVVQQSLGFSMCTGSRAHLDQTLNNVRQLENFNHIQIIGLSQKVLADSEEINPSRQYELTDPECAACHQTAQLPIPQIVAVASTPDSWRVSVPIENQAECHTCHDTNAPHLGMLLMDISAHDIRAVHLEHIVFDVIVTLTGTLIFSVGTFFAVQALIIRRIDLFQYPLEKFRENDFSVRIPQPKPPKDELDNLIITFNQMSEAIEQHTQAAESWNLLNQQSIAEERQRIGRELHDGLSQILGYINTKTMAIRLYVKDGNLNAADRHLESLEVAVQGVFADVRERILSLNFSGKIQQGLIQALDEYISQFTKFSGIPTAFIMPENLVEIPVSPEIQFHLFRIVQEALSNIRKHSVASQAWVELNQTGEHLELVIGDNGIGFETSPLPFEKEQNFGLKNIRARAAEIGAAISIQSLPGEGTHILVKLKHGAQFD